jgi:serine/threonine protein kinase
VVRVLRPLPSLPQSCGRYRIASVLGRGAMGVVYKAHDPLLDRDVAVKLIKTDLLDASERDEYLQRFMREAQAAARCAHRGIVGVYDFSENGGHPFIVMEFVEGPDLRRVMRTNGAQAPEQAVPIMLQVLDALTHAHRLGIVHRDIKPPNILMPRQDEVKITDFGIARLGASQATQTGVVIGTPQYMAPEQARGDAVDLRADLFSAAAVFWEMLAGRAAFAGDNQAAIMSQVMFGEPQAPPDAVQSRNPAVYATLRRALAKAPNDRFQSAAEFAASLESAAAGALPADDRTSAATPDELYRMLGAKIANEADRTSFIQRSGTLPRAGTDRSGTTHSISHAATSSIAAPSVGPVSADIQSAAQAALTTILGPIARVLVRQALAQSRSSDEFLEKLDAHLARDEERAEFRRQLRNFRLPHA